MRNGLSLLVGLVFGLGLCVSGMNDPSKVIGFLDLAGDWDPSLAFVMASAIAVAAPAFAWARHHRADWSGSRIVLPENRRIDVPLASGAVIFGVGWGLGGLCPGPAIVDVGFLSPGALLFVAAMAAGALFRLGLPVGWRPTRTSNQDA